VDKIMTDKTTIYLIEPSRNVILVKEKEGTAKDGDPKQVRISKFRSPISAANYLKEKFGIKS
jgi:hypothetical protein